MEPTPPQPQEPQPYSELASFGEELRREREIRGISLKEISDATKISKRFLEAIERNDHKTLPAPVFTRGFVREYARYLGLNAEDMVNRYNYAAAGDDRIERTAHLDRLVQPPASPTPIRDPHSSRNQSRRPIPPPYARIDRNVYLLVIIVAALIGVSWWAIHRKRDHADEPRAVETTTVPTPRPVEPRPTAAVPPPAPVRDDSTLRLVLDITADSWIDLEADGKSVFKEVMRKGEHHAYEAKERFLFHRIGNAAGVSMTLNETRVPPLGGDGDVRKEVTFDRDRLQQLRSATP
ncbi:MAG: DUF4115 domain-containing protein [Acidobacteria bacterium]|nr:DUF4115 domain-containing protein [Acidobacteriota bacterium]